MWVILEMSPGPVLGNPSGDWIPGQHHNNHFPETLWPKTQVNFRNLGEIETVIVFIAINLGTICSSVSYKQSRGPQCTLHGDLVFPFYSRSILPSSFLSEVESKWMIFNDSPISLSVTFPVALNAQQPSCATDRTDNGRQWIEKWPRTIWIPESVLNA